MKSKQLIQWIFVIIFFSAILVSWLKGIDIGCEIGDVFFENILEMLKILPCAFILISLFDQWAKRQTIERHLGINCGFKGYLWAILLGGMSIGGLYVAFPVAYSLYRKGASLKVLFSYIGFAGVCRIPMTLFEISFLGLKFTLIRLAVSIPLILITGIIIGTILEKKDYQIKE